MTRTFLFLVALAAPSVAAAVEASTLRSHHDAGTLVALVDDGRVPTTEISALVGHSDWRVRQTAQAALLFRTDGVLAQAVLGQEPQTSRAGFPVFASGPFNEPGIYPLVLERLLHGGEDSSIRVALAQHLGRSKEGRAWTDALTEILRTEPDAAVRAGLVEHWKRLATDTQGLALALDDADGAVRAEALRIVGYREDGAQFADDLRSGLSDRTPEARAMAARGIGWLRVDAGSALVPLLADPDAEVRFEAMTALETLDPVALRTAPAFQALLADPAPRVQAKAQRLVR